MTLYRLGMKKIAVSTMKTAETNEMDSMILSKYSLNSHQLHSTNERACHVTIVQVPICICIG